MNQRDARATLLGSIVLFGIPALGLIWLISVIPPVAWLLLGAFVALAFCIRLMLPRDSEKARVEFLRYQVSKLGSEISAIQTSIWNAGSSIHGGSRIHEIPPLERRLTELESALSKAQLELQRISKASDVSPFSE